MAASARASGEIVHARDGAAEADGFAAAAIATRFWAARFYARPPGLPFTTRSLTRTEHLARGRRIVQWTTIAFVLLVALMAWALVDEGTDWLDLALFGAAVIALGAGTIVLLAKAQRRRSDAYRDPLLTITVAGDRLKAHSAAMTLIDAPWRELRVVDLLYDKVGSRAGTIAELAGIVVDHRGQTVSIHPEWIIRGRAATTAIVKQLAEARRLSW